MYTKDKHMERVRRDVGNYAIKHGIRAASRHFGYVPSAISKWVKILYILGNNPILTKSSRPKNSPNKISRELKNKIIDERVKSKRCSEVVHRKINDEGDKVSLSTVKRVLDRANLIKKRSPWKRYHPPIKRPRVEKVGDLIEIDNIHLMVGPKQRIYVTTLIDVYSRLVYAKAYTRIGAAASVRFTREAKRKLEIDFNMLQTDHGSEFSNWFVQRIKTNHRYTRLGKPNDNAHIERFNRTIQEEFLDNLKHTVKEINTKLPMYLKYYNEERMHLGINFKRPKEMLEYN
jgi:transposase InsO family protein